MSTPIRKPTEAQALAWLKANPEATDAELAAYVNGTLPTDPSRFKKIVKGFGRGAAQGVTLGFADEIVGALDPTSTIDEQRAMDKDLSGFASTAGNIAGGI